MIELHLHLDGSLRPSTVLELGKKHGVKLPADTVETLIPFLRVPENCGSLNEYLERFDLPISVMQTEDAMEQTVFELVEDLVKEGLDYAEIRFAPQFHTQKGLTQSQVVAAAIKGLDKALKTYGNKPFNSALILCCMRGKDNHQANLETVRVAKEFLGKGVCAVDLAGAEGLFPTEEFEKEFSLAKELGVPFTIHAGEAAGPDSIRTALRFGTKRIGHGINAIYDEDLIKELVENNITLEISVLSNIHTKCVKDGFSHPIRKLFDKGVRVTVNTDNRTVSNTTIPKEYELLKKNYGFTDSELKKTETFAYEARFCK